VSRATEVRTRSARARSQIQPEPMAKARVGVVPIVWNNADLPELTPSVPAATVLDEIARLGFAGTQLGIGFPRGRALAAELAKRDLRLAEVYVALPCDRSGPGADGVELGRAALEDLHAADGDVLVVALALCEDRDEWVGRAAGAPSLTDDGWRKLGDLLNALGREASGLGHRLAFHNHAATYVETPDELDRLVAVTSARSVGLCMDVGHATVGGGDPAQMIRRHSDRVAHVHLKDVAPGPLDALRDGRMTGFTAALRARIFAPLGSGVLDLPGVLTVLAAGGYEGWLMVEQDTSWEPPSEAAAIGKRVLDAMLRWPMPVAGERR
jgi:inosose dehydratase